MAKIENEDDLKDLSPLIENKAYPKDEILENSKSKIKGKKF